MNRRDVLKHAGALGATVPFLNPARLFAAPPADPRLQYVHPEYREFVGQMLAYRGKQPPLSRQTLPQSRQAMVKYASPVLPGVPVEKRTVRGSKGQPDVTVYVVNGGGQGARPAILHTHGGGFVSGSAAVVLRDMQDIATALNCVAVTVEYRLAPETTYAGSIEDNYAGLKWLYDNAEPLGVDRSRIALMGESAGGGHAALLAIAARDRGEVPVAFQCLTYPMLDDRTGTTRPVPPHIGRLMWSASDNQFGWRSFLGSEPGVKSAPQRAVPARQENLRGLPPAFIGVGSLDLFCDEDIEYAQRLNEAGSTTELIVVPGGFHGFDVMPLKTKVGAWFKAARLDALRRGLSIGTV